MDAWKLTGAIGVLVVVGTAVVGVSAFLENYLFDVAEGARLAPTFVALFVTVLFVFALFAVGARSDRWLQSPYW